MPTDVQDKIIYRTFRAVVKEVDAQAGIINMVIPMSTGSVDRDEEVIDPSAFKATVKDFLKRPILLSSHQYGDLRKQIGEFKSLKVTDEGLMAQGLEYYIGRGNEEADWGFYLATRGMAAFSVGFIPQKWSKLDEDKDDFWGNRRYEQVELLEISQVVVPSNRDAIQGLRGKAKDQAVIKLLDDVDRAIAQEQAARALASLVTKPEETEDYFRIPVKGEAGKHDDHRIRTIDISKDEGIKALYCGECKVVITYLFSKDEEYGWTMASAQDWVDDHSKSVTVVEYEDGGYDVGMATMIPGMEAKEHTPPEISQQQLQDDIDYVRKGIAVVGMNPITQATALQLACEVIERTTGADIPVEILTKVGAVLNTKNKDRLHEIRRLAQEVLDSAGTADEGDKHVAPTPEPVDPEAVKAQREKEVADVASMVIAKLTGKRIKHV